MSRRVDWPEIGEDSLDPVPRGVQRPWHWLPHRRLALGGSATATPTLLFVLTGAALGPDAANILSPAVLAQIQALAWVGLAVTGVFVGLGLARHAREPNTTVPAGIVVVTTVVATTAGLYLLIVESRLPVSGSLAASSLLLGLCATVAAAVQTAPHQSPELRRASRIADLDDVPVLLLGVAVLAVLGGEAAALRLVITVAAGGAIGLAGCLLFERAGESERGLFVTGAVLLLAGVGAYLGTSPLVSGGVAALVWVRVPGAADRITEDDLRILHHPLAVLLLVIAGASTEWTLATLWIAAYIVILRLASKLLASVLVARMASVSPALLASVLLPPGMMGLALAVNVSLVLGDDYRWIVSSTVIATVVSEVLATLVPRPDETTA